MLGLMQPWSMTLDTLLTHAAAIHTNRAVTSQDGEGHMHVHDYAALFRQARKVSAALVDWGIRPGDRIGTLMWNDIDHLAFWYGAMGIGAVVHTLNPRLGPERIGWIAEHGGDRLIVCSSDLIDIMSEALVFAPGVQQLVVAGSGGCPNVLSGVPAQSLDAFLSASFAPLAWGGFDENRAAGLCYTSGTTGDPKGVLYSHRSNLLHALTVNQPGGFGIGPDDVVLAVVPMFHANAWALPFIAPMVGAELVLPGRHLGGASLTRLITQRGVTFAAGVPTVWQDFIRHLDETGNRVPTLERVVIGGSAPSRDLVEQLNRYGIEVMQGWGMTELSPIGSLSCGRDNEGGIALDRIVRQGQPPFSVSLEIFDDAGLACCHDDRAAGMLKARGPNVVRRYFGADTDATDDAGWFATGDIARIDAGGSIQLLDRAKDLIKSGGEWISSIDLENLAETHPAVRRAAVIAIADPRWGERPLLVIEVDEPCPGPVGILDHIRPHVPAWWMPDRVEFRSIPLGATGKIDKRALRREMLQSNVNPL